MTVAGLNGWSWYKYWFADGYGSKYMLVCAVCVFLFKMHYHSKAFSLAGHKFCKHSHVYLGLFSGGFVAVFTLQRQLH
jgi:hypothetical protein